MIYFDVELDEDFDKSLLFLYSEDNEEARRFVLGGMSRTAKGAIGVVDFTGVHDLRAAYENGYPMFLTLNYDVEGTRMFVANGTISETKLKEDSILLKLLTFNPGATV